MRDFEWVDLSSICVPQNNEGNTIGVCSEMGDVLNSGHGRLLLWFTLIGITHKNSLKLPP